MRLTTEPVTKRRESHGRELARFSMIIQRRS
jgi:hypothetical protein